MLVKNNVYFSDVPSLNDPLECPLLKDKVFEQEEVLTDKYEPRIFSLVVPPPYDEKDENGIHAVVKNTLLFNHYADAHKGICIEYVIELSQARKRKDVLHHRTIQQGHKGS